MNNSLLVRRQVKIGPEFSFSTSLYNAETEKNACKYYEDNLPRFEKDASFLESDVVIFFDTNVLLYLYTLPASKRDGILKYISKNKDRVFFTGQVIFEYLKHRSSSISAARKSLKDLVNDLETIIDNLVAKGKKETGNKLEQFKQLVIIKNEMPSVIEKINTWWNNIDESLKKASESKNEVLNELKSKISEAEKSASSLTDDKVLETVCCAKNIEPLSAEEKEFLSNLYTELLDQYNRAKENVRYTFPGCGDKKKKEEGFDPCGDFYIYHEMLALMKELDCDAMFITNDVTKSDWVLPDRRPIMHYLFDEYAHSGHMINIVGLDAIPMDMTPIIPDKEDPYEGDIDGQINEPENQDSNEEGEKQDSVIQEVLSSKYTKEITEERFVAELKICINWATNYGGGFVNEEFFLRNILAVRKHYSYEYSKEVLQRLIKRKIVKSEQQEHEGVKVKCLVWGEKYKEKEE